MAIKAEEISALIKEQLSKRAFSRRNRYRNLCR